MIEWGGPWGGVEDNGIRVCDAVETAFVHRSSGNSGLLESAVRNCWCRLVARCLLFSDGSWVAGVIDLSVSGFRLTISRNLLERTVPHHLSS